LGGGGEAYLKAKIEELDSNSKIKKILGPCIGACNVYGVGERCVQGYGGET